MAIAGFTADHHGKGRFLPVTLLLPGYMKRAEDNCCATLGECSMSDNRNLSSEQICGFVRRFDSQVALLKNAVEEVRRASNTASGLERATRALLTDGGAIDFPSIPGVLCRLARNRQMGALLTDGGGEILLANKSFYDLTGYKSSDSAELELYLERSGKLFRIQDFPWQVVLSTGQFQTSRLALSDGSKGERLRWLQFCCQPLLSSVGGLEGVLSIVAEATEEIEIEDRVTHVIDLLAQQLTDMELPAAKLSTLKNRVRGLDDFLPRENVLPLELAAVEDTLSDDQQHYKTLLEGTAVEAKEKRKAAAREMPAPPEVVPAHQSSTDILQESISAEAASAIQAFEDSFSIDLDTDSQLEDAPEATELEQDIFASQTDFAPLQETAAIEEIQSAAEELSESDSESEIDPAATYLPSTDEDTQLWSEFSDFSADKLSQIEDIAEEEEQNQDLLEPVAQSQETEVPEISVEGPDRAVLSVDESVELPATADAETEVHAEYESAPESETEPETESEINADAEISVTMLEAPEPVAAVTRAAEGKCALIVDDIPVNQKLLVLQLKRLNFATDIANNGQEALSRLAKFDYDIVFMDCDMPVMNGYDATMAIRKSEIESGRHIAIVAMTSYDRDADKERCLAAGMDDYLTKGVNASSLARVIERCCDQAKKVEGDAGFGVDNSETEPFDAATMATNYGKEELNEVVRLFLSSMEIFVNSMQKAIDSRDGALVTTLANSIKGPSATLGLQLITKVTNDILTFSEAEDWPQVRLKYLKLKTVYLRSQEQLRKLCPDVFTEGAHLFG